MNFFIILSKPLYIKELWSSRKFQGPSLSEVIEELEAHTQRGKIDKVKLKLLISDHTFVATMRRDDEDSWQTAKRMFNNGVKEVISTVNEDINALGTIDVHVEPFHVETVNFMATRNNEDFF